MMHAEARWLGSQLQKIPAAELGSVLSIGSGTDEFRTRRQPWIDRYVFSPLRARQVPVFHHELFDGKGVDIAGDLHERHTLDALDALDAQTVLFCNVLEHVDDRDQIAASISALVPNGGRLLVTVPHRFPYHPDPIDTMFRPTPSELLTLFPLFRSEVATAVRCESLAGYWLRTPARIESLRNAMRSFRGQGPGSSATANAHPGPSLGAKVTMALVRTTVTCAVLVRHGSPGSTIDGSSGQPPAGGSMI